MDQDPDRSEKGPDPDPYSYHVTHKDKSTAYTENTGNELKYKG